MIDLESLLSPLDESSPVGPDLRLEAGDTTFADIRELRRVEDPEVDVTGRGKDADWTGLVAACETALGEKSKDLELAAYLTEGLTRTEGFPGLLVGLRLVRQMLDQWWDSVHPGCDPDDGEIIYAIRARWVNWLGSSREFLNAIRSVPITSGPGIEERGWGAYEDSSRVDDAAILADQTQYNEILGAGLISGTTWRSLLGGTPPERLQEIVEAVGDCEDEARALDVFADERFEEDVPNLVDLLGMLDACRSYLEDYLTGALPDPVSAGAEGGDESSGADFEAASGPAAPRGGGGGPIGTRDEAYRRLREVAEYLRRTEPHSPVSALLDRAVNWGGLSFQELFLDVLKHQEDAREQIFETLGIQTSDEDEE